MTIRSTSSPTSVSDVALASPAQHRYGNLLWSTARMRRWCLTVGVMAALTGVVAVLALRLGAQPLTWAQWWEAVSFSTSDGADVTRVIVWDVRFPRILLALVVGAALAITGAVLQTLVRNPLADPYVLGIASGAALGATIGLGLGLGTVWGGVGLHVCAFIGGVVSIALVYGIAVSQGAVSVHTLLLAGVILNAVCSAVMMFATSVLNPAALYRVVMWLMGTLSAPSVSALAVIGVCVGVSMAWLLANSQALNLLAAGDDAAQSMGLETDRMQRLVFVVSALLTGVVVSLCGMIGFVGMVVPHLVRMLCGADHRLVLPVSALAGGLLLILADALARTVVAPAEVPVGVVTALIGGPFFLYLLVTRKYRFST